MNTDEDDDAALEVPGGDGVDAPEKSVDDGGAVATGSEVVAGVESSTVEDPVATVDALVATIVPGLAAPAVCRRDVVALAGPWLSGVSSLVAALSERLPHHTFVESSALELIDAPLAVVFVASAAMPLTESDCQLLDMVARCTDGVLGVVSKIDVHQDWRAVLATDRETVAGHAARYDSVAWVGAAAAPELGEPRIDELVESLGALLADTDLPRRNRLRVWEARLERIVDRFEADTEGVGRRSRVDALLAERRALLTERRRQKNEEASEVRGQIQQARVELSEAAHNRCAEVRGEYQERIAALDRRGVAEFVSDVRARAEGIIDEIADDVDDRLDDLAYEVDVPLASDEPHALPDLALGPTPLKPRGLEIRLMALLGAAFGLGVALALSWLFASALPTAGLLITIVGIVLCSLIGLGVTGWVVRARGLRLDRALLERWLGESMVALCAVADDVVAGRIAAAETELNSGLAARNEDASVELSELVGVIDAELGSLADLEAQATEVRERALPEIWSALAMVRAELGDLHLDEPGTSESVK